LKTGGKNGVCEGRSESILQCSAPDSLITFSEGSAEVRVRQATHIRRILELQIFAAAAAGRLLAQLLAVEAVARSRERISQWLG